MSRLLLLLLATLTLISCGASKEDLMRQQLLELQRQQEAERLAQQEALKKQQRREARQYDAHLAWVEKNYLTSDKVKSLFESRPTEAGEQIHYLEFDLKPGDYDFDSDKQPFAIAGMRTLNNSRVYSPLFPDTQAEYQPGQKAKSVIEFTLERETEINRVGIEVEKQTGTRWVAATENFKLDSAHLVTLQKSWQWETGLFDDLSWAVPFERARDEIRGRQLKVQIGFRFCSLQRCQLEHQYLQHPINAIRGNIASILISNRETNKLLAEFYYEGL